MGGLHSGLESKTVDYRQSQASILEELPTRCLHPPDPPRMPTLRRGDTIASTEQEKVELLCDRFYPNTQADLDDVTDTTFEDHTFQDPLSIDQLVSPQDIHIALHRTNRTNALGSTGSLIASYAIWENPL
jgi:hypothetical protein